MNRAFSAFVKSMCLASLAVSLLATAQDKTAAPAKPDAAKGASLFTDGDASRSLPACVSCHGAGGNSTITANPKLAGQHEEYLYKQLVDFTKPERTQAIMSAYARLLTDDEKKNIA